MVLVLDPKFFLTNYFFDPNFLLQPNFCWTKYFLPKIFFDQQCTWEWSLTLVLAQLVIKSYYTFHIEQATKLYLFPINAGNALSHGEFNEIWTKLSNYLLVVVFTVQLRLDNLKICIFQGYKWRSLPRFTERREKKPPYIQHPYLTFFYVDSFAIISLGGGVYFSSCLWSGLTTFLFALMIKVYQRTIFGGMDCDQFSGLLFFAGVIWVISLTNLRSIFS